MALPIKSVGVKADLRSYEHPVLITGEASWEHLLEIAGNLFKSVEGINRCIWNLGPVAPRTVRPLAATVTRERLDTVERLLDLPAPKLFGRHQFENAGVAIAALRAVSGLKLSPSVFELNDDAGEFDAPEAEGAGVSFTS